MKKKDMDMRQVITVLVFLLTACSNASVIKTQRQTISPELIKIHESAINGDPEAQFELGWHYVNGKQVKGIIYESHNLSLTANCYSCILTTVKRDNAP